MTGIDRNERFRHTSGSTTALVPRGSGSTRPDAALLLILTVAFMVVLDFSIVNVALAVDRARAPCRRNLCAMGDHRLRHNLWRPSRPRGANWPTCSADVECS